MLVESEKIRRSPPALISSSLEGRVPDLSWASTFASPCALGKSDELHDSPQSAFASALKRAGEGDKIVVFGSFLTVGEVMAWLKNNKTSRR